MTCSTPSNRQRRRCIAYSFDKRRCLSVFAKTRMLLTLTGALALVTACQRTVPPPVMSPVNNPALPLDQATQTRNFDQSISYYPSGAAIAGGTGYLWQTHETIPDGYRRVTDVPVAGANILSLPLGVFVESPWKPEVYHGEQVPPSNTAQPPLP